MRATMRHHGPADAGRPIPGTFYPNDAPGGGRGIGSALPKILGVLLAVVVLRTIARAAGHGGHGGSSRWSRRREAIAEFHRELHAQDAQDPGTASADEAVKA
jgi:hypothetical protein